jgi:NADH-quinone oxidoreductase subunit M
MAKFGGLMGRYPNFALLFFVLCLASVGLPGLNNFVSEMLMMAGLFDARNPRTRAMGLAVAAAAGIFLSAWYTFTMLRNVFFNPHREPERSRRSGGRGRHPAGVRRVRLAGRAVLGARPVPAAGARHHEAGRAAAGDRRRRGPRPRGGGALRVRREAEAESRAGAGRGAGPNVPVIRPGGRWPTGRRGAVEEQGRGGKGPRGK